MGNSGHEFHFRDKEIGGKHGMCCEFPQLWELEFIGDGGKYFCDGEWCYT